MISTLSLNFQPGPVQLLLGMRVIFKACFLYTSKITSKMKLLQRAKCAITCHPRGRGDWWLRFWNFLNPINGLAPEFLSSLSTKFIWNFHLHTRSNTVLTCLCFANNINNNSHLFIQFQNYKSIVVNCEIFSTKLRWNRRRMTKILVWFPPEFSYKHTSYTDNVSFNFYFNRLPPVYQCDGILLLH